MLLASALALFFVYKLTSNNKYLSATNLEHWMSQWAIFTTLTRASYASMLQFYDVNIYGHYGTYTCIEVWPYHMNKISPFKNILSFNYMT